MWSAIKRTLPALALAALAIGTVVWGTLSPGYLVFRTAIEWDGNQPVRSPSIREWRLEIPREFVVRRDGYATKPYRPFEIFLENGENLSFVWLGSRLDVRDQVVPYTGGSDRNRSFTITIRNGLVDRSRAQEDYCLTRYQRTAPDNSPDCTGRPNCSVYLNYSGWPVEISVQQDGSLFKEPARVCEITRTVLSKWTKAIDELRTSKFK